MTAGRPTKFTPERCAAIIDAVSKRVPYGIAAEAHGISEETFYDWLRTAKKHREEGLVTEFTKFSESIKKVEMERITEHSSKISANVDRWQADAWMLERRWHKYFGANAQLMEVNAKLDKLLNDKGSESNKDEQS